jgi:hypothetical protein
MSLENYTGNISDLVATNPTGTDPRSQGDDHLRGIKYTLKQTFPAFNGPVASAPSAIDAAATGLLSGLRNIIINGDMRINQRGVTIAAAAIGAYGPDRWKKVDAGNMTQIVEDGNYKPGKTYTLSGTGLTTQQLTSPASGNWTLPNIPIAATSIQLEEGSIATPFEQRQIGLELSLCQRYYSTFVVGVDWQNAEYSTACITYPETMRIAPLLNEDGTSAQQNIVAVVPNANVSPQPTTTVFQVAQGAPFTNRAYYFNKWKAEAEL